MTTDIIVGNVYDKYGTRNPLYRWVVDGYFRSLERALPDPLPHRILEVGCGEGHLAGWLRQRAPRVSLTALDLSPAMLAQAHRRYDTVDFACGSAFELPFHRGQFELVLFLEVLEHLPEPRQALREARRVCAGQLVASVPREPIWRVLNLARGAYWRQAGNTPGHLQHWGRRAFLRLLGESWQVRHLATPLPWVIARCD
jgi:ubiquinone/menaquinone biosynthesis C-methylase UbiE